MTDAASEETEKETLGLKDYTQVEDLFTSEIFKIEIKNLRPHLSVGLVKKRLQSLGLNPHKVKVLHEVTFVTFKSEEDRIRALEVVNGHVWKGNELTARPAKPKEDPFVLAETKRQSADMDSYDQPRKKKVKTALDGDTSLLVKGTVTPLWKVDYCDQLKIKYKSVEKTLVQLSKKLSQCNLYYDSTVAKDRGLPCQLKEVLPSPVFEKYRNKCQFTIGANDDCLADSQNLVIGFRVGKFKDGDSRVVSPIGVTIVPDPMMSLLEKFQLLLNSNPVLVKYGPFDSHLHTGHWRELTLRCTELGQSLAILEFHPQSLGSADLEELENTLTQYCESESSLTSLYIAYRGRGADYSIKHLSGATFIQESHCNLVFNISPNAFFQVNTPATEVLYSTVAGLVKESSSSCSDNVVLDVCCGTGTISLCVSGAVKKVLGIEMVAEAVDDAKQNAVLNSINNVEFLAGKAEDLVPKHVGLLASQLPSSSELIVIVDPPRSGLHASVINILRRCERIKTIIYISCNPESALVNFVDLGRSISNKWKGTPFLPTLAQPVDLFPQTEHCELILVFKRQEKSE